MENNEKKVNLESKKATVKVDKEYRYLDRNLHGGKPSARMWDGDDSYGDLSRYCK